MIYDMFIISVSLCVLSRGHIGCMSTREGRCTWRCTRRWYTEHVKHVKNTQFEVGSWQVAAFDGLCFVGQVCHGELNGSVLSTTYIMVVGVFVV